ncbi:GNAT family N-acetyltransferase [Pseudomonas sp. 91RF]|uniref:GNAT family N-acetyltransferase n=1 Tax=Pseudomonas sp. 91RF TaxID=2292261 RepID=UPI000E66B806|nr:GNAT family N-acetyltransferase [Pseudomonas sp. 91RF]RIJ12854.1 GNAT family N-acetyltransferase [Pseudomonas sp. 91RF]
MSIVGTARIHDGLRTVIVPSVSSLNCHAWDALVADRDFYHCHGWLSALEHALGPAELLTLQGPNGLSGGCALWSGEREPGLFCLSDYFPGLAGPWQREFLWIGARRSTHNEIPCSLGSSRDRILRSIMQASVDLAQKRGLAGVLAPYMPLGKALELAAWHDQARVILHSAEASLAVPPGGLAGAMEVIDKRSRWRTRKELSVFAERGCRVEWRTFDPELEQVASGLIAQNRSKYGSQQGAMWMRRMFDGQRRSGVLDAAIAAVAYRSDKVIAVAVFYRLGKTLHYRYFGSDYRVTDDDFRYFVLSFYELLDWAAAHGVETVELSTSSLQAKSLRGGIVNPLAAVVLLTDSAPPSHESVARHNTCFAVEHRDAFKRRLSPDWNLIFS